jgi:ribosome-associated protein
LTSQEKSAHIAAYADDIKAERIEVLEVRAKTTITDYFVVCSGNSQIHANAIAERVVEKARETGFKPLRRADSAHNDGWILVDFGDVILHVMLEEKRQFYDLESLWSNLPAHPDIVDEDWVTVADSAEDSQDEGEASDVEEGAVKDREDE